MLLCGWGPSSHLSNYSSFTLSKGRRSIDRFEWSHGDEQVLASSFTRSTSSPIAIHPSNCSTVITIVEKSPTRTFGQGHSVQGSIVLQAHTHHTHIHRTLELLHCNTNPDRYAIRARAGTPRGLHQKKCNNHCACYALQQLTRALLPLSPSACILPILVILAL